VKLTKIIRCVLAGLLLAMLFAPSLGASSKKRTRELDLLRALNRVRAQSGLRPLVEDWHLCAAARHHSKEMVAHNVFGHGAFAWRMAHFHVRGPHYGEALAWGNGSLGTSDAIVNAWLNSPEHRALLLSPVFRRVGVGEADGPFAGTGSATVATADFAG
jgi:uncharacterized protein YkwD